MPRISTRTRPRIPAIPGKTSRTRLAEAYEKLGITEAEANNVPKITHILKELPKKLDQAIEFLRGSHEPDATKLLVVYGSLPISTRKLLPIEAFCVASGLTTKRVLEVITGACFEQSDATAALLSKAAKPLIVKRTIKLANKEKNWDDRKTLLQHEGYAPVPKTQIVNVERGDINMDNRQQQQSISIGSLTQISDVMGRITDRFNERHEPKQITGDTNHEAIETDMPDLIGSGDRNVVDSDDTGELAVGGDGSVVGSADGQIREHEEKSESESVPEWEVEL